MYDELNLKKYFNYKVQSQRLKKALNESFYLEAIFIEYVMMEDRTESILRYEGNEIKGDRVSIHRKIAKIKKIAKKPKSLVNKYFQDEFMDEIIKWKDERNRLMHALMKQTLTTEELRQLAEEGQRLVKDLNRLSTNYKRAVERKEAKSNKETLS